MNKIVFIVTAMVGVILTVVGAIVLFAVLPKAIESKVADEMYIQNGTGEAYQRFVDLSVPLLFKINFFHIDDPNQFDGVHINKIKFRQRGPYIYKEKRHKAEIKMDPSGNTVEYEEKKDYEFDAEKSHAEGCTNCTKDDKIRLVHIGLGMKSDFLILFATSFTTFTIEDTVDNFAFKGVANLLGKAIFKCLPETEEECKPKRVVGTGKDNIDHLGTLYEYAAHKGHTQFWSESKFNTSGSCSVIRGTDATQFHPNVKEDQTLYAYEDMLCRSVKLVKGLTDQEHQGISTLRFYTDDSNFAASEENQCFCYEDDHTKCDAGTLNLRNCPPANKPPIEVVASQPFFMSNQALLEETGLAPLIKKEDLTQEKYGTILDVEPYTGLALYARKRVQISVMLKKGSHPLLMNLAKDRMYGPILWIEEAGDVDKVNADKLKDKIFGPKKTYTGLLIGVMALGVLLLAAAGGCAFFNRR